MFTTLIETEYKPATKEVQIAIKVSDTKAEVHRVPLSDWRVAVAQVEAQLRDAEQS